MSAANSNSAGQDQANLAHPVTEPGPAFSTLFDDLLGDTRPWHQEQSGAASVGQLEAAKTTLDLVGPATLGTSNLTDISIRCDEFVDQNCSAQNVNRSMDHTISDPTAGWLSQGSGAGAQHGEPVDQNAAVDETNYDIDHKPHDQIAEQPGELEPDDNLRPTAEQIELACSNRELLIRKRRADRLVLYPYKIGCVLMILTFIVLFLIPAMHFLLLGNPR